VLCTTLDPSGTFCVVLRENSVQVDFIGFPSFRTPCFRHEDPARGGSRTVSQSARLHVVQSGGMDPDSRAQTATQHLQAEIEKANPEKQGPAVLVPTLKDLDRLDIRADPR
jgi:hypothetical protein